MIVLILYVFILLILVYGFEMYKVRYPNMPPKFKDSLPVLGLLHLLTGQRELMELCTHLGESCRNSGGILHAYVGHVLAFGVTDPEECVTILNSCLEKGWLYDFLKSWLGDGMISNRLNLGKWKNHRRIINRAFNQQVLDSFMGVFNMESQKLVEVFAAKVDKGPFDHLTTLEDASIGIMFKTTMGLNESDVGDVFDRKYKHAIREILEIVATRIINFWAHSNLLYAFSSMKRQEDAVLKVLHRASHEVLEKKRLALKSKEVSTSKFKSFLDLLLELPVQDAFTDQEIREEVDTMIVAGSDTTATMLTFALMLLGHHQDIQDQVYQELIEVIGETRDTEKQDLSRLVLLEAVLMETMRLFPIMPVLTRYVAEDVKLKNYTIRGGSTCFMFVYVMHRDPALWGDDAAEFRPQRWLPTPPPAARAFAGFSIGKRGCIGKAYAMMSMKTVLSHVVRNYRISADMNKLELKLDGLIKPKSGCEIALTKRI